MDYIGTPGQTRITPVDPNTKRISLEPPSGDAGSKTFNLVMVGSDGRVISGKLVNYQTGSGSGSTPAPAPVATNQLIMYASDPNAEGVSPPNTSLAALAYSLTPGNPMYVWNPLKRAWQ